MMSFTTYLNQIAHCNNLSPNIQWLFYPGMLQDSPDKWWDDFKYRHAIHEGIDICFFKCPSDNKIKTLGPKAPIPAMASGIVRNVCPDFLGQTIVVEPDGFESEPRRILTIYSHQTPEPGILPGKRVMENQIISRIFDTRLKKSKLLSHLHLSWIEVPRDIAFDDLNWKLFPQRGRLNLINPVFV